MRKITPERNNLNSVVEILKLLKNYKVSTCLTLLSLLLAVACEILLPFIIKNAIDRDIVARYYKVNAFHLDPASQISLYSNKKVICINHIPYVLKSDYKSVVLSLKIVDLKNLTEQDEYFVFSIEKKRQHIPDFKKYNFNYDNRNAAIPIYTFDKLPLVLKKVIRQERALGLKQDIGLFILVLIFNFIFSLIQALSLTYLSQNVIRDLRQNLYEHVISQSLAFIYRNSVGKLISRMVYDVDTINVFFNSVLNSLIRQLCLIVGVVVALFLLDVKLALVSIAAFVPIIWFTYMISRFARKVLRIVRQRISQLNNLVQEYIYGIDVVKLYRREDYCASKFIVRNNNLQVVQVRDIFIKAFIRPFILTFSTILVPLVLYYGGYLYINKVVTVGCLIAFINLLEIFFAQLADVAFAFIQIQSALAGGDRVFELLNTNQKAPDKGTETSKPCGVIKFRNVSFSYDANAPVLKNVSFEIKPGEKIAIVGYTGSGKTTLINLLLRFWDPICGSIEFDNNNIQNYSLQSIRKQIKPILQENMFFSGPLKENIELGEKIPESELIKISKYLQIHDFIDNLPQKYHTILTEGGMNLSSGQRQLLSITRAFVHNPAIIIMDEVTGYIDYDTEKLIYNSLNVLLKDKTAIIIAHKLSTIKLADRIVVLNNGAIVETGTHEELFANKNFYYNLFNMQMIAKN